VPWVTPESDEGVPVLGKLDWRYADEAERHRLCLVCGLKLDDPVWFFRTREGEVIYEGLHGRCARLSLAHCPHLTSLDGPEPVSVDEWWLMSLTPAEREGLGYDW
jgi:hypothetical protein